MKVTPPEGWPLSYEMCLICGSAFVASWTVGARHSEEPMGRAMLGIAMHGSI